MTEDQFATVGDVELCYRRGGDPDGPPVLFIMGLGAQMLAWPDEFIAGFGDRQFSTIIFDNRDVGLSTLWDDRGPSGAEIMAAFAAGELAQAPYSLSDMAGDAVGLLTELGIDAAHVVGASMGGMIAQQVAIDHPDRVLSLTSIMSTTGAPDVGQPTPEAMAALTSPAPADRESALQQFADNAAIWSSPEYFDREELLRRLGVMWDRVGGSQPDGTTRQMAAIMTGGSREEALAKLSVPALVMHGDADTLVTPSGGARTAEVIPGAELMMLDGMGHDLPPIHWQQMTEGVLQLALRAANA